MLLNGHGGNAPAAVLAEEWSDAARRRAALYHEWFGPQTYGVIRDDRASTDSMRPGGRTSRGRSSRGSSVPSEAKPPLDDAALQESNPQSIRELAGDGSFGGPYERPHEDLDRVWQSAVAEARDRLANGWN